MRGANPLKEILDKVVKFHGSSSRKLGSFSLSFLTTQKSAASVNFLDLAQKASSASRECRCSHEILVSLLEKRSRMITKP